MSIIALPRIVTYRHVDEVIRQVSEKYLSYARKIKFDFQEIEFISAYAMATLLVFCRQLKQNHDKDIFIKLSSSPKLATCHYIMSRLGFFQQMPSSTMYYPYKPKIGSAQFGKNEAILEILPVDKTQDPRPIVERARRAINVNTNYTENQILDICKMIAELLQNIVDHSETEIPGYIAIQNYTQKDYIQLVIVDGGIGIPPTIRSIENEIYATIDDEQALREAIKLGVSRFGKESARGEGLAECIRLAQRHKARFYIRSNSGSLMLEPGTRSIITGPVACVYGAQAFLNFPFR